ncbi:mechanosensitive ion channel family protein [Alkalitalea saponilacus]|uniref:Mechanosensitive ion channel n=1 Tax=Alkalitalea saponilacus TaxID=889453 RepID=A0A1T5H916_9BACT|nr:mechanosensitive ion channel domain-containing protein [Alkalitalea saponilacus]ASB50828.1 mechanosensitive ion channel protein MscS [Alkalitalea saponilacus]SKC17195.1 Mechanosensitive ion channel [Alkalitalea saponilacus]
MIDSVLQNEGWLFQLTGIQYLQMGGVAVLTIFLWMLFGRLIKKGEEEGTSVALWIIRLVLLLLAFVAVLYIAGLTIAEFFSMPVVILFDEVPVSPILVVSVLAGIYFLIFTNNFLKSSITRFTSKFNIESKVGRQVHRFFMIFLFLVVGGIWLKFAGEFLIDFFGDQLFSFGDIKITPGVLFYVVLVLYGIAVALRIVEVVYTRQAQKKGLSSGQSKSLFQILKYLIWLIAVLLLLDSIGVSINMLIAGSAALLVGLGFGIQGLFNDFVSGLVILFEGIIKAEDVVELESGVVGRVLEVGLRTSKIRTRDNIIMIVPNNKFVSDKVINWSYNEPRTRFSVDVGVAYGSDVRLVEKLLLEAARECEDVIRDDETIVLFTDFGDSSLDFRLLFWIDDVFLVERIRSKLRFAIDAKFREHNVTIPFPQRDLHLKSGFVKEV